MALMTWSLVNAHVLDALRELPADSVDCVVTSPPYMGLRAYGTEPQIWGGGEGAWRGELGSEPTIALFIDHLLLVFDEIHRVLKPTGTCWVNLGDSYAGSGKGPAGHNGIGAQEHRQGFKNAPRKNQDQRVGAWMATAEIPAKNLCLIPERFVLAMQERGWWVRSRIAWCKLSAMPESVTDRPTSAWEHIFLFTKSSRYYYDANAVREPGADWGSRNRDNGKYEGNDAPIPGGPHHGLRKVAAGANLRNYWLLGPEPYAEAHFATFPTEIPRRAILAGTSAYGNCAQCGAPWTRVISKTFRPSSRMRNSSRTKGLADENGWAGFPRGNTQTSTLGWQPSCKCGSSEVVPPVVLDPFLGSGTTLAVAKALGRDGIGIELNPDYLKLAEKRIGAVTPALPGLVV